MSYKQMLKSFFRRWWMVRKLHKYIFREGDITPILGSTSTRSERMRTGANQANFIQWFKREREKRKENFDEWSLQTLNECMSLGYIEQPHQNWIRLGSRGMEIYVWYYPIVAFFSLHYVKIVITKMLEWGIPLVLIYIFAKYLNIIITASPW